MQKIDLPGYEVLEMIGEGGMSTVWTARQLSLDRLVAVKFLSSKWLDDPSAIERFHREAQSAARLKHPGIVQVYDAGEYEGTVYYVMEFVAGCTVGELLRRKGHLSDIHALQIATGVALALSHAWTTEKIIHCDIKPENIMIDRDGTVKVADLGLARVIREARSGYDEMISGTPNYISPEQACGEAGLDCRTDIYSLGAMLYHLVTGFLPFHGLPDRQVMEKQVNGFLPDPIEAQPETGMEMAWLIEKMMVKARDLRSATWKETLEDFDEVHDGFPPKPPLPAPGASTISRCPARAAADIKKRKKTSPKTARQQPVTEPKQRIVLPKDMHDVQQRRFRSDRVYDMAGTVVVFLLLAGCLVGGWFLFTFLFSPPDTRSFAQSDRALPPRSTVLKGVSLPTPTSRPVQSIHTTGNAESSDPGRSEPGVWNDPEYQKGARAFNEALALYKTHLEKREDISMLPRVEELCRQAAKIFESRRSMAPSWVPMEQNIQQCYKLISDCRQSTLLKPGIAKAGNVRSDTGAAPPAGPPSGPAFFATNIELAANWDMPIRGSGLYLRDLGEVLSDWVGPDVKLEFDPSIYLFGHINMSLPAQDAARLAGVRLKPRKALNAPAFPQDSFFYYEIPGEFGNGFHEMLLLVDRADRAIGVQLINDSPDTSLWLEPQFFTDKWHVHDFVRDKSKGNSAWKIAHRAVAEGNLIRIDSELVTDNPSGYFGLGDSKCRVSLYLPENVAALLLHRIQKNLKPDK